MSKGFSTRGEVLRHLTRPELPLVEVKPILANMTERDDQVVPIILVGTAWSNQIIAVPVAGSVTETFVINFNDTSPDWCVKQFGERALYLPVIEMKSTDEPSVIERAQAAYRFWWLKEDERLTFERSIESSKNDIYESLVKVVDTAIYDGPGTYNGSNILSATITGEEIDAMIAELHQTKQLIAQRDKLKQSKEDAQWPKHR